MEQVTSRVIGQNMVNKVGALGAVSRFLLWSLLLLFLFYSAIGEAQLPEDTVLVLRPESKQFESVAAGIEESLEGELLLVDMTVDRKAEAEQIREAMERYKPKSVVVMDNAGVIAYRNYQIEHPDLLNPPAIILATLFVDRVIPKITNSTGIYFEVPAVTSLVDLRNVTKGEVKRVGALYRENTKHRFLAQQSYCRVEEIELIGIEVDQKPSVREVKKRLKKLLKMDLDAIWVMNDANLITKELLVKAWIPRLKKFKKPVVVGIESLIKTKFKFGDYAVFPDRFGIGEQASGIIFELMDNDWRFDEQDPQQPISIKKSINLHLLSRKNIAVHKNMLNQFESVIE